MARDRRPLFDDRDERETLRATLASLEAERARLIAKLDRRITAVKQALAGPAPPAKHQRARAGTRKSQSPT
jgi:hypothetical protein